MAHFDPPAASFSSRKCDRGKTASSYGAGPTIFWRKSEKGAVTCAANRLLTTFLWRRSALRNHTCATSWGDRRRRAPHFEGSTAFCCSERHVGAFSYLSPPGIQAFPGKSCRERHQTAFSLPSLQENDHNLRPPSPIGCHSPVRCSCFCLRRQLSLGHIDLAVARPAVISRLQ